jgi:hypothetical protein
MFPTLFRPARPAGVAFLAILALALLLPAEARAACTAPQLFGTAVPHPAHGQPNRLVLRDLNGDGVLDVAFTTPEGQYGVVNDSIEVMLGMGGGLFGAPAGYGVGSRPEGICAADLDGDGTPDLAVTNWNSNSVSILHGVGDGTFTTLATIDCGVKPYDIVATDLKEDGIPDLVVASNGQFAISVLVGLGGGAFAAPVGHLLPDYGLGVVAGDLNGDGHMDVVATAYQNGCVAFLGAGSGMLDAGHPVAGGPLCYSLALELRRGRHPARQRQRHVRAGHVLRRRHRQRREPRDAGLRR